MIGIILVVLGCFISDLLGLNLTNDWPGFDFDPLSRCSMNVMSYEGTFNFDDKRGIAYYYFDNNSGKIYFEYWAPIFYWVGFTSTGNVVNIYSILYCVYWVKSARICVCLCIL